MKAHAFIPDPTVETMCNACGESIADHLAPPPPEAAEGTRYREGWCNWQAVSVRLFHHVNATWDEVRDELDRREARLRALEAALGETGVGQIVNAATIVGHHWVRGEVEDIWWCQWCGRHRSEVADWMDHPQCPAVAKTRAVLSVS